MNEISLLEIDSELLAYLAVGANVLGSGGGGDPAYDLMIAQELCRSCGAPRLLPIDKLSATDLVVPVGFTGAPMVCMEKLPSGEEFVKLFSLVADHYRRPITAVVASEVGGSNALVPFAVASRLGLPVVDADMMGRAFPKISMTSCALDGMAPSPAFICDALGNSAVVYPRSYDELETMLRALTVAMGSSAAVVVFPMSGEEAKRSLFSDTLTEAIEMGRLLTQGDGDFYATYGALLLTEGVITDIDQQLTGGFLKGSAVVTTATKRCWRVHYQNEYLMVEEEGELRGSTPDVIIIFDRESGLPLPVERLRYGLRVEIALLEGRARWKTQEGLKLVGLQNFGYV